MRSMVLRLKEHIHACYFCNNNFGSKGELMSHRKKKHSNAVRNCTQFQRNNCRFQDESCWFSHSYEENVEDKRHTKEGSKHDNESESVFQNVRENLEPPLMK